MVNGRPAAPLSIEVRADDIDHMGHVNNSIYLRWIEQAVHDHWKQVATPQDIAAYRWIAVRHEIDYRAPAFPGDLIAVSTELLRVRRARAWYATIVSRDGKMLAEAQSCWCLLDAVSNGLTVIPDAVAIRFGIAPRAAAG